MKKFLCFIIIAASLVSCGEDISNDNTGVFRGIKDNGLWEGGNSKATIGVGNRLTIEAATLTEVMSLKIPLPPMTIDPSNENTFVTHILGTSDTKVAMYTLTTADNVYIYKTGIGSGDGQVVISQYDGQTVSGTFRFNALNQDLESEGQPSVNLQEGVFYKVPVY
ncbi:DUF6252 family protein [Flavobacterium sp.]|uniref:DUF6252 family protein n=1 Tax=Flavobacterium sp. TaxID=239 RepID=UPI00262FCD6B|nr:DUF6252 family protein [Flavobacterium sp.]